MANLSVNQQVYLQANGVKYYVVCDEEYKIQDVLDRYRPCLLQPVARERTHGPLSQMVQGWADVAEGDKSKSVTHQHPAAGGLYPPNWRDPPKVGINQMYWPTGASRFAVGHFLMQSTTAAALLASYNTGGSMAVKVDNVAVDPVANVFSLGVIPLEISPLTGAGTAPGLSVVTVTDPRYWGQWYLSPNPVSDHSIVAGITKGTLIPDIDSDEFEISESRSDRHLWQYDALGDAHLMRFVYKLDGSWTLEGPTEATATHATNSIGATILGGAITNAHTFPNRLFFVANGQDFNATTVPENWWLVGTDGNGTRGDRTLHPVYLASANARDVVMVSSFDISDPTDSTVDLSTQAEAIAEECYARAKAWAATRYDYTFPGLQSWNLSGFDDFILWSFGSQSSLPAIDFDGMKLGWHEKRWTRVVSQPIDRIPRFLSQRSTSYSRWGRNPPFLILQTSEAYSASDLLDCVVASHPDSGEYGWIGDRAASSTLEVFIPNAQYEATVSGKRFLAAWNPQYYRYDFIVWMNGGGLVFADFTLTAALATTNATGSATISGATDALYNAQAVTLANMPASTDYTFYGDNGDKGRCFLHPLTGNWVILNMECP